MRLLRRLAVAATLVVVTAAVALIAAGGGDDDPGAGIGASYPTVADLTAASDLVVTGVVEAVGEGRITPAPPESDSAGTLHLDVAVRVDDVLAGRAPAGDRIIVSWPAWEVAADGYRRGKMLSGGQPLPEVGDRDVWFLFRFQSFYGLTALEGRFGLEDGTVAPRLTHAGGSAAEADGLSYEGLKTLVTAP